MSMRLESLTNTSRKSQKRKLLGRGTGCKKGKTCGRGQKGMGARSGYKTRRGYIGGGARLHMRLPTRGFSNARFARRLDTINLEQIETLYQDGETVSLETLREKNYIKGESNGVKVLGEGSLTKKLNFQVEQISKNAKDKLEKAGITVTCSKR
ncbi:MAG: 50S ribosomal protein L15 [Chlamydiae bacterium]|nr:50S ribosomal protein L15 [Chlamydiota bacterium]